MGEVIKIVPLGACLLNGPLNQLFRSSDVVVYPKYGPIPYIYTLGELHQALDILRGEGHVPSEIRPLCGIREDFQQVARAADFDDVDVFLVSPSSPIEIIYRSYRLNRAAVSQVLRPVTALSKEAARYAAAWLRNGLMEFNEEAQFEAAKGLIALVPADLPNRHLLISVLEEARSEKGDLAHGFRRLTKRVRRPTGVILYAFQYMADGRVLSWPHGFMEEVEAAATTCDLEVFDPSKLVIQYGLEDALSADLRHYSDPFAAVMADALVAFSKCLRNGDVRS